MVCRHLRTVVPERARRRGGGAAAARARVPAVGGDTVERVAVGGAVAALVGAAIAVLRRCAACM